MTGNALPASAGAIADQRRRRRHWQGRREVRGARTQSHDEARDLDTRRRTRRGGVAGEDVGRRGDENER